MSFTVALTTVLVMLVYSVPGFWLIRSGKVPASAIPSFATFLVYVCTPVQILYAMQQIDYSPDIGKYMLISMGLSLGLMGGMLLLVYALMRRKLQDAACWVCVCSASLGNMGFMGIPLLQALMPDYPQMQVYASFFFLSLNIIMYSLGSWVMTGDRRYMSVKKALVNPAGIAVALGLGLMFSGIRLTGQPGDMVSLVGRMATPVCMLILGMRLALTDIRSLLTNRLQYLAVALKLIVFPLLALAILRCLPVEADYIRGVYLLCCVPVGNLVLSFAEMLGEGQQASANVVLLSTLLSMLTIPAMLMLV